MKEEEIKKWSQATAHVASTGRGKSTRQKLLIWYWLTGKKDEKIQSQISLAHRSHCKTLTFA
jgi:hypothetical protein